MSYDVFVVENTIKIPRKKIENIARELFKANGDDLPSSFWDDEDALIIDDKGQLYFDPDHEEHKDWLTDWLRQEVLRKHKVKGRVCFMGEAQGQNPPFDFWGYEFDGKGGMKLLDGYIRWNKRTQPASVKKESTDRLAIETFQRLLYTEERVREQKEQEQTEVAQQAEQAIKAAKITKSLKALKRVCDSFNYVPRDSTRWYQIKGIKSNLVPPHITVFAVHSNQEEQFQYQWIGLVQDEQVLLVANAYGDTNYEVEVNICYEGVELNETDFYVDCQEIRKIELIDWVLERLVHSLPTEIRDAA